LVEWEEGVYGGLRSQGKDGFDWWRVMGGDDMKFTLFCVVLGVLAGFICALGFWTILLGITAAIWCTIPPIAKEAAGLYG